MTKPRLRSARAFTLVEFLVVVAIIAVVFTIVLPRAGSEDRLRLIAAAQLFESDFEYAQVLNVTKPDDPVIIKFNVGTGTYWIAREATPDTPIDRPDTNMPYLVTIGMGRARHAVGVVMTLTDVPGGVLTFTNRGGLADFALSPRIRMTLAGDVIDVLLGPETGDVDIERRWLDPGEGG